MTVFHDRLRQVHSKKGITQLELAKQLGVSSQTMSYIMNGREPNFELLVKIAEYFDCTTDYLLGLSKYKDEAEAAAAEGTKITVLEGFNGLSSDDEQAMLNIIETLLRCHSALLAMKDAQLKDVFLNQVNNVAESVLAASSDCVGLPEILEFRSVGDEDANYKSAIIVACETMDIYSNILRISVGDLTALIDAINSRAIQTITDTIVGKYGKTISRRQIEKINLARKRKRTEAESINAILSNEIEWGDLDGEH
jgi:DNA-binding XRE family transcriptional regulator